MTSNSAPRTRPMTATPTPWHSDDTAIFAEDGVLARIPNHPENGKNWVADAAFIVEAVNSYASLKARIQELTKVLEEAQFVLSDGAFTGPLVDKVLSNISVVLQKDTPK